MSSSQAKYKIERHVIIPPGHPDPNYYYTPDDFQIAHSLYNEIDYRECLFNVKVLTSGDYLVCIRPACVNPTPSPVFKPIETHEIGLTFNEGFILNLSPSVFKFFKSEFHILIPKHVDFLLYRVPETLGLSICFYYSEGGDQDE